MTAFTSCLISCLILKMLQGTFTFCLLFFSTRLPLEKSFLLQHGLTVLSLISLWENTAEKYSCWFSVCFHGGMYSYLVKCACYCVHVSNSPTHDFVPSIVKDCDDYPSPWKCKCSANAPQISVVSGVPHLLRRLLNWMSLSIPILMANSCWDTSSTQRY